MRARWGSVAAASFVAALTMGAAPAGEPAAAGEQHQAMNRAELKWGPVPESLPPGAKAAVIQGDPAADGKVFTLRLKAKKGYRIPPHTHPTTENVTVISGRFLLGEGDKLDRKAAKVLTPGGFASIPAGHHHFAIVDADGTEVQVHAVGPFEITYLNPADDPRKKQAGTK